MVCTFGDLTDVIWWRELRLPVRAVLGADGRLLEVPWGERRAGRARTWRARGPSYDELNGQERQPGAPAHRRAAAASPAI